MGALSLSLSHFPKRLADNAVRNAEGARKLSRSFTPTDQVVSIVGRSVASLTLAAQLGRAAQNRTDLKIILILGPDLPSGKLIGGCSLRRGGVHLMAQTSNRPTDNFIPHLGGRKGIAYHFDMMGAVLAADGHSWDFPGERLNYRSDNFIGLSTSYATMLEALETFLSEDLSVQLVAGDISPKEPFQSSGLPLQTEEGNALLEIPEGRSVIFNATRYPNLLRPRFTTVSSHAVVAFQVPLRKIHDSPHIKDHGILTIRIPANGDISPQQAFFSPFSDPSIPEAAWYGINTMIVPQERAHEGSYAVIKNSFRSLCRAFSFEPIDANAHGFQGAPAVQEVVGYDYQQKFGDPLPVFDLQRGFSAGHPIVHMDGILAEIVGASAYANALLKNKSLLVGAACAFRESDTHLLTIRDLNHKYASVTFNAPEELASRQRVRTAKKYPQVIENFANMGWTHST